MFLFDLNELKITTLETRKKGLSEIMYNVFVDQDLDFVINKKMCKMYKHCKYEHWTM